MGKLLMIIFIMFLSAGCAVNRGRSLLVVAGTKIGISVGVNELTQLPEGTVGYKRIEGSVVPVSEKKIYTAPTIARLNFISALKDPGIESFIATGEAAIRRN